MGKPQDKIGFKEFLAISLLMMATKVTDDVPAMLFDPLKNTGWMGPIISGIIALVPLFLLLYLLSKYKKGFIDICLHVFGRYLGSFVLFLLWGLGFSYIVLDTATYTDIISTMYFVKAPPIVIYSVLMLVSAYGAKKGLEQIGSAAWSTFPYLQASLLLIIFLSIFQGDSGFLFPILGPGEWEIIKGSTMKLSIYADFIYLMVLFPFVSTAKDFNRGIALAFLLLVLNLSITMASYVIFFDYKSAMMLNYPYHEVIRSISLGFLSNVETFFFPFWLIASFIKFSAYLYINVLLFGRLFKIEHFEFVIPAFATLIVLLGIMPESPTFSLFDFKVAVGNVTSPFSFLLPIIMWLVAKLKGDLQK